MRPSWLGRRRARTRLGAILLTGAVLAAPVLAAPVLAACSGERALSYGGSAVPPAELQARYESVVDAVLPSVVQISTNDSAGSGVVYDSRGGIVTNEHVVGGDKTVRVLPAAGQKVLDADVIGVFRPDDLAVIRVTGDAGSLRPARFADSDKAVVGEIVLAMGNPLGLTDSVTQGIVSATGRTVDTGGQGAAALLTSAIQTSAAINPGNSGGALVDLSDQVLGIPTLTARDPEAGGAVPGIGFAIPSNTVRDIAGQIIEHGKVTQSGRATLDITGQTADDAQGKPAGVAVIAVTAGGAAAKAGIRPGDLITGMDGEGVLSMSALESDLAAMKPGQPVSVELRRDDSDLRVRAGLDSLTS